MQIPSEHDPYRPTNWRWERARWLREHGKYARRDRDDEFTLMAKRFQSERDRARNDLDLMRLERRCPGIYQADQVRQREEGAVRWTIEAMLLAAQPLHLIAERAQTSAEVVYWYEKLFFNVLPCLRARYYIVNVVIGTAVHHGLNDREYDVLWKMFGYFGGPHVLDFLITTFSQSASPAAAPDGVPAYLNDDGRLTIRRKTAIAARLLPLHNTFTMQIVLETYAKMLDIERQGEGGGGTDAMMSTIGAMMSSMGGPDGRGGGLLYAGSKPSYVDTPGLRHYDGKATELRAHEQLAAGMGREDQGVKDETDWTFPEPPPEPASAGPVT